MTDMDADALRLRKWQSDVESRLAALESKPVATTILNQGGDLRGVDRLKLDGCVASVESFAAKLTEVEDKVNDTSGVLAGVEAALGSHAHPPSSPAEPPPAASLSPSEPISGASTPVPSPEPATAG